MNAAYTAKSVPYEIYMVAQKSWELTLCFSYEIYMIFIWFFSYDFHNDFHMVEKKSYDLHMVEKISYENHMNFIWKAYEKKSHENNMNFIWYSIHMIFHVVAKKHEFTLCFSYEFHVVHFLLCKRLPNYLIYT